MQIDQTQRRAPMAEREAVGYLLERGLIDRSTIVDGDLRVIDASRRNSNFRVVRERGPSYLLKQGAGRDPFASPSHEAFVYALLRELGGADGPARLLPRLHAYDAERDVLIVELIEDADDLRTFHHRRGAFPRPVAAQVGCALAQLHAIPIDAAGPRARELQAPAPAGLFLHRPGLAVLHDLSGAAMDVVRLIQRSEAIGERLEALRRSWRRDSFIHHDMRWDNLLVARRGRGAPRLWIVDWEAAGLGDPAWDLGGVLGDYLACWLTSIPLTGHDRPDRYLELARCPLRVLQPAIVACWQAYLRTAGIGGAEARELLRRSALYAGLKLMEMAIEHVQHQPELDMTAVALVQVGSNVVSRPAEAAGVLLGLAAPPTAVAA